jgi:hypothetical protein
MNNGYDTEPLPIGFASGLKLKSSNTKGNASSQRRIQIYDTTLVQSDLRANGSIHMRRSTVAIIHIRPVHRNCNNVRT